MRLLHFAYLAGAVGLTAAQSNYTAGFQDPVITASSNGSAICVTGLVNVTAAAQNVRFNLDIPANQSAATEIFVELLQSGSTLASQIGAGMANVSGTYLINARLCYPRDTGLNASAIQILTHGVGFSLTYWDSAPGYSYVDVAAAHGYATFLYDRLGVGESEKADPIQVVQGPLEISIAHSLIEMLKAGDFASTSFTHVIGVGHSYGSEITSAIAVDYPDDISAAILTGYALAGPGIAPFLASLDLQIASQNNPVRFSALNNGYLIQANAIGNQFAFLRYPGYPASNLNVAEVSKDTVTFGELLSMASSGNATTYTGPVDVVNGINDLPFCGGNCTYGTDQTAAVQAKFPATRAFASYNAPLAGHGLNLHYSASDAFVQIQNFLKSNGL